MDVSSQLAANKNDISGLFQRMSDFEKRLKNATTAPHTGEITLSSLNQEFTEFKSAVLEMLSKLSVQTELLSLGQEWHEMFLRRKILLFHGVAESKDENVSQRVMQLLSDTMKLPDITLEDLQSCHRLGGSKNKARPILVRFRDLEVRRLTWESKTALKGTGIVLSEFLTKLRHDVFMAARKHFGVRNSWTSEGKIVITLPDKSRKKVETSAELQALISMFPVIDQDGPSPANTRTTDTSSSPAAKSPKSKRPKRNKK